MTRSITPTNKESKEAMAAGKALDGEPYAGNPHMWIDEGEVASAVTPRRGSLLYKTQTPTKRATRRLAAALAIATAFAATGAWAYEVTDYWTGAKSGEWAERDNWRWDADGTGTSNYPAGTYNTKHAVFVPKYMKRYDVSVSTGFSQDADRQYLGHFAVGAGTEESPVVISCSDATKGVYSNQSGMWFALGFPLNDYYAATNAVLKFSGGTYGPWQAGAKIGSEDGAYSGHLILDGSSVKTTFKSGTTDDNALILYSGKITSTDSDLVSNGRFGVAKAVGATGIVEKTGGDWTIGTQYNGRLYVGDAAGAHAEFYNRGGSLTTASFLVIGNFGSGNDGYAYMELDGGSVTNKSQIIILGDSGSLASRSLLAVKDGFFASDGDMYIGNTAPGEVTISGGTISVNSERWTYLGKDSGSTGTLNLNGGTFTTKHLHKGNGSAIVNFNGGTLKAAKAYASNGGLILFGVTVNVNAGGGTIDSGNNEISIAAAIGGGGGLIFTGGNTITLTGKVSYSGKTSVTPGTILATSNDKTKDNIRDKGLVVAGLPVAGQTIMTYTEDLTESDYANVTCPLAPGTEFGIGEDGKSIVVKTVGAPLDNYWTGAVDNDLSNDANWSSGTKPTGNANIFCATPATLTKGATFAPTSITFLEGSAAVTIDGDFTSLTKITNSSSVNQTFAGFVDFGTGNIDVTSTAAMNNQDVTGGCVVFKGGVKGAKTADNHTILAGDYTLTTTDKFNATSRFTVNTDSSLSVKATDQIQELYIREGSTFTVASAWHGWGYWGDQNNGNHRLWCWNKGTFVATNYTFTGAGQMWFGGYLGNTACVTANANAVLKVGRVDLTSSGALWLHGYSGSDNNKIYIGADGINLSGTGYIGVENSSHSPTLWPWNSDYTIGIGSNSSYDLRLGSASDKGNINLTLQTDDEAGVPRTVTLAARVYTEKSTSSITVAGHGTNIVTSLSSGMTGTYSLTDSATAIFNAGAGFGDGSTISLGAGTTLEYANSGNTLALPCSKLALPSSGAATLRIGGDRLRGVKHTIATGVESDAADHLTVDPASAALDGRKATLAVEDGALVLDIQPVGFTIIVS